MNELHCLFGKIFAFVKSENYIPCRHWSVVASVDTDKHISLHALNVSKIQYSESRQGVAVVGVDRGF